MKILLIHYRYYEVSGPEKYLFNIKNALEELDHEVIPFTLGYHKNKKSKYEKYHPEPIAQEFHLNKAKLSIYDKIQILFNSFYNISVYNSLSKLIRTEKPDIAYVLQYTTKLSISPLIALRKNNIPIVHRLSDFNLVCAKNTLFRESSVCTKCLKSDLFSIKHKCVNDSLSQSLSYFLIRKFQNILKFQKLFDLIIAPSYFTIKTVKKVKKFKTTSFLHLPTFYERKFDEIATVKNFDSSFKKLCYVGRIAEDKGLQLLIEAFQILSKKKLKIQLDIYGDDTNEFSTQIKNQIKEYNLTNINFKGYVPNREISSVFESYDYSIIPSLWYDNMPNSFIESCRQKTPVICSRLGSLEELIEDGATGYFFYPINGQSLSSTILKLYTQTEEEYHKMTEKCYEKILSITNKEAHLETLLSNFEKILNEKTN